MQNTIKKQAEMQRLEREEPAVYRRMLAEKEAKQKKREE